MLSVAVRRGFYEYIVEINIYSFLTLILNVSFEQRIIFGILILILNKLMLNPIRIY